MIVSFVDTNGGEGWIDEDLSLTHFGQEDIVESIEATIDGLEVTEAVTDEVVEELLIELPDACAIREINRVDSETGCGDSVEWADE